MNEQDVVAGLRAVMKHRKISLTELADKLNIPYRSLQNWFSGNSSMGLETYISFAMS